MRILYTPAGDTDPIRNYHDGGILHILRHYNPEKIFVFLSAEMKMKEEQRQIYTKAIKYVAPSCELNFIKTDIIDVHRMENLFPLIDEYLNIRKKYPNDEILLNLSSGTPQMKTIMSFIATDFDNVRAVQVDSPAGKSNRSAFATQDNEDIDVLLELNEDNEKDSPNRCSEPPLNVLQWYSLKHQLISLVNSFEYRSAYKIYAKHKNLFAEIVGDLLQHCILREDMRTKKAFEIIKKVNGISLDKECNAKVKQINEFLMIMELRQKKGQISEFLVKITPFLYELTLFHLQNNLGIKAEQFCDKGSSYGQWNINKEKLKSCLPQATAALEMKYGIFRDRTDLSFTNILEILNVIENSQQEKEINQLLNDLRTAERKYRNVAAHVISEVNDDLVSSAELMLKIRKVFCLIMEKEDIFRKNIYYVLNEILVKELNEKH